ncbi:sensor histidine kinase [Niabella hibiscisoli]|uniref:sensor histidine kinase n=1 Tax=Niabella hibiscisoli TaxID=1825928 RepID=UPI001F0E093C|nr:hypothetical protein [Niabella hibiscisoli]MCH5720291.1 hypothetical protein [Niabella hibiscisoli]
MTSFEYREDMDPAMDIHEYLIPALMLQPIIENAIEHGVTHIGQKGSIDLRISLDPPGREEKTIEIKVTNDGPSLDKNLLILNNHALSIIQEQLFTIRKKYGTGTLTLQNNINRSGVNCTISLPAITLDVFKKTR